MLLALTLVLGALLSRVSLCAVAGMQQAVVHGDFAGLERMALAACGAGLSLLLFAGLLPAHVSLPNYAHFHPGLIAGGVLLGLGAMLNGGCYLGSVLYLGTGNLNFLFTLLGLGVGLRGAAAYSPLPFFATPMLRMAMGYAWMIGLSLFAVLIVVLMRRRRGKGCGWRWPRACSPGSSLRATRAGATALRSRRWRADTPP